MSNIEQLQLPSLAREGELLFVHAHPDDEVLTAEAIALGAAHTTVRSYTATDGEASTLGDQLFVRSGGRRLETAMALSELGIATYNQSFGGHRDAALNELGQVEHMAEDITELLQTNPAIGTIVTPGAYGCDGSHDHRAVHRAAVLSALQHGGVRVLGVDEQSGRLYVPVNRARKLRVLTFHSQFEVTQDATLQNPRHDLEIPGFRVSEKSAALLAIYRTLLTSHETYQEYLPAASRSLVLAGRV